VAMVDNSTNNALSALNAYATMLNNTANNIANVNTGGYKALETSMKENAGGGVAVSTSRDTNADRVDLSKEAVDLITAENGMKANIAVVRTAREMQKSVIDMLV
jgi:flagellar hook protein FlgE